MSDDFREEIMDAIGKHGLWKMRLKTAARNGEKNLPVQDICRDDKCKFGKWLKTVPDDGANSAHLGRTRDLHAEFHTIAGGIAGMINKGDTEGALAALETGAFKDSSGALIKELTNWKRAV